jgi:hypothetical protein
MAPWGGAMCIAGLSGDELNIYAKGLAALVGL